MKRGRIARALAGLVLLACWPLAVRAATIEGSVVAQHDATALSGMTVAAYSVSGTLVTSGTTNASGRYAITLSGGDYRVLAWDPTGRYATSFHDDAPSFDSSTVVRVTSTSVTTIDFRLRLAGFVTGTVRDAAEDTPLAGMVVAAWDASGHLRASTASASAGGYRLALPEGDYRVAAWDDTSAYAVQFHSGRASYPAADPVTVIAEATTSPVDFALLRSATMSGTVTDSSTGAPLAGMIVEVWLDGQRLRDALTDASGEYEMPVSPAPLRVLAWDPAGAYATAFDGDASSFDTSPFRSPAPGESFEASFALVRGGRVSGAVRSESGTALTAIAVGAFNLDGTLRGRVATDASGGYSLVLPPGSYIVGAWDPQLFHLAQFHAATPDFATAEPVAVFSSATSAIDFFLTEAGRAVVTVLSRDTGAPLHGVQAYLYDAAGRQVASAPADTEGHALLAAKPAAYHLVAADPEHVFVTAYYDDAKNFGTSTSVRLVAGSDVHATFRLRIGGTVSGLVRDRTKGEPVAGVFVAAYDLEGARIGAMETDAAGSYSILLPPGTYVVVAADALRRYRTSWYDAAESFHLAKQILLGAGIVWPIDFHLDALLVSRIRPVRR